jgi:hypothetical protein
VDPLGKGLPNLYLARTFRGSVRAVAWTGPGWTEHSFELSAWKAAIVLDAAAYSVSTVADGNAESAKVCVCTGSRTISLIAEALARSTSKQKRPDRNVSRKVYEDLCVQLAERGISLKPDREACWTEFVGLRSRYAGWISYLAERAFVPLVDTLGELILSSALGPAWEAPR